MSEDNKRAKKKTGYFIKDHSETVENTVYVDSIEFDEDLDEFVVRELVDWAWDHNDGWDWIRSGVVFTLVVDGKEIGDYEIEVRTEPLFYAHRVKP